MKVDFLAICMEEYLYAVSEGWEQDSLRLKAACYERYEREIRACNEAKKSLILNTSLPEPELSL